MALKHNEIEDIVYIIIASVTVLLNLLEIIFLKMRCGGLKPHDKLLLSLAVSDLLVAVMVTIYKVCDLVLDQMTLLDEEMFSIILVSSLIMSSLNLLAITLDRFLAIKYPLKHLVWGSRLKFNTLVGIIWTVGLAITAAISSLIAKKILGENTVLYISAVGALLLGLIMMVVYLVIIHKSCTSRALTRDNSGNPTPKAVVNAFFSKEYTKERHIFFTCCLVSLSFMICSYPFAIDFMLKRNAKKLLSVSRMLLVINSTLNPIIYFFKGYLERSRKRRLQESIEIN